MSKKFNYGWDNTSQKIAEELVVLDKRFKSLITKLKKANEEFAIPKQENVNKAVKNV